eukprot:358364_1
MACECLSETWKWIRTILYLFHFMTLFIWAKFIHCQSTDDAIDDMAEYIEHKHPIQQYNWKHNTKVVIRPTTFHERATSKQPKPVEILFPTTKDELKQIIQENERFRAIGSGHSFRDVIETDGVLISLQKMNKLISIKGHTVTVEAGIKIRHLIRELELHSLALPNMGNYDRQSLGGAIVGGTHGTSGNGKIDTFTSSIVQLKMINAKGDDITLSP